MEGRVAGMFGYPGGTALVVWMRDITHKTRSRASMNGWIWEGYEGITQLKTYA